MTAALAYFERHGTERGLWALRMGIDELFAEAGTSPAVIYRAYAEARGRTVPSLTDEEKLAARVDALLALATTEGEAA